MQSSPSLMMDNIVTGRLAGIDATKVKIWWNEHTVKYKDKVVFHTDDQGARKYEDEAALIQQEVEDFMTEWRNKRQIEEE